MLMVSIIRVDLWLRWIACTCTMFHVSPNHRFIHFTLHFIAPHMWSWSSCNRFNADCVTCCSLCAVLYRTHWPKVIDHLRLRNYALTPFALIYSIALSDKSVFITARLLYHGQLSYGIHTASYHVLYALCTTANFLIYRASIPCTV